MVYNARFHCGELAPERWDGNAGVGIEKCDAFLSERAGMGGVAGRHSIPGVPPLKPGNVRFFAQLFSKKSCKSHLLKKVKETQYG